MTPTSRESTARVGRPRRFLVTSIAVVAALALACVLMGAVALARGPQIRDVAVDAAATVAQRGITLTVRTDQPLAASSVDGVVLEPSAPVEVEVAGASLRVRFTETLAFATDYRLTVPGLIGQATGTTTATAYDFTTPPLTITTLERGGSFDRTDGADDAVVRHDLSHGIQTTVLSAPRIQEYAESGGDTVALLLDRDGASALEHVGADGVTQTIALPGSGDVRLLRASSDAGRIGFVFTGTSADGSQQYSGTLFLADPSRPEDPPRTIPGIDGAPVRTDAWQFVPGSSYLVAQTPDRSLILVDATGAAPPRVLGQLGDFVSILPGTTSVVVDSDSGQSILDLTNGSVRAVPGTATPQPGEGNVVLSPDTVATWTATRVTRSRAGGDPVVVDRSGDGERFEEVCASPSGRHLAIGAVPAAAPVDGYPARADRIGRSTDIVDVATGDVVGRVDGTRPDWCS